MNDDVMQYGYDYEDEVTLSDSSSFITLEPGEYDFEIIDCERGRFAGGGKTPPCNKITFKFLVRTGNGNATFTDDIILHPNFDWQITQFCECVGAGRAGDKVVLPGKKNIGDKGRFSIERTPNKKDPNKFYTRVAKYLKPGTFIEIKSDAPVPFADLPDI